MATKRKGDEGESGERKRHREDRRATEEERSSPDSVVDEGSPTLGAGGGGGTAATPLDRFAATPPSALNDYERFVLAAREAAGAEATGAAAPFALPVTTPEEQPAVVASHPTTPDGPICTICFGTVRDPLEIPGCGHSLCKECTVAWCEHHKEEVDNGGVSGRDLRRARVGLSCPTCRNPFPRSPAQLFNGAGFRFARAKRDLRQRAEKAGTPIVGPLRRGHYHSIRDEIQVALESLRSVESSYLWWGEAYDQQYAIDANKCLAIDFDGPEHMCDIMKLEAVERIMIRTRRISTTRSAVVAGCMIMALFVSLIAFVFIMVFVGWRVMLGVWGGLFLRVVALVNHLPPPSAVCWVEGAINWVLFTFANTYERLDREMELALYELSMLSSRAR